MGFIKLAKFLFFMTRYGSFRYVSWLTTEPGAQHNFDKPRPLWHVSSQIPATARTSDRANSTQPGQERHRRDTRGGFEGSIDMVSFCYQDMSQQQQQQVLTGGVTD